MVQQLAAQQRLVEVKDIIMRNPDVMVLIEQDQELVNQIS